MKRMDFGLSESLPGVHGKRGKVPRAYLTGGFGWIPAGYGLHFIGFGDYG
jgi:hypothetical protein